MRYITSAHIEEEIQKGVEILSDQHKAWIAIEQSIMQYEAAKPVKSSSYKKRLPAKVRLINRPA